MVARNLASFASQHAVRDVPFVSHQKGRIEISNMFPVATISGAGIATNQHTVRYPSVKAEEFCFLTSCLQQPKMCVGCFVLLRPGHFGLSQAQKADGNLEERDPGPWLHFLHLFLFEDLLDSVLNFSNLLQGSHGCRPRAPPWNRSNLVGVS